MARKRNPDHPEQVVKRRRSRNSEKSARQRTLHPGFWQSDQLLQLTQWHGLLFQGLWNLADREGRLEDRPYKIALRLPLIFQWLNKDDPDHGIDSREDGAITDEWLNDLVGQTLIDRYEVDGLKIIQVLHWDKFQRPSGHEPPGTLPERNYSVNSQNSVKTDHVLPKPDKSEPRTDKSEHGKLKSEHVQTSDEHVALVTYVLDPRGTTAAGTTRAREAPKLPAKERPVYQGQRLTLWEWQFRELRRLLGSHAEGFDLDSWVRECDDHAVLSLGVVTADFDWFTWLKTETVAEAGRRHLDITAPLRPGPPMTPRERTKLEQHLRATGGTCGHTPTCEDRAMHARRLVNDWRRIGGEGPLPDEQPP